MRLMADPTRMTIYEAVLDSGGSALTAADVAGSFDLHVNVARMHLEKLAGAGLLKHGYRKPAGGGRPAREYTAGDRAVSRQYPPRDYQMLADITLLALASGRRPVTVARETGRALGEKALSELGLSRERASSKKLFSAFAETVTSQGLFARVASAKDGVSIRIFNCTFKELSRKHGDVVCGLHRAFFTGLGEVFFGKVRVSASTGISKGAPSCEFRVSY